MPADTGELFEALEALLKAEKELKRQKRALFPAVLARRRATSRVLEIWRAMKGEPSDPSRPILDVLDRAGKVERGGGMVEGRIAPTPATLHAPPSTREEGLPDGSPARPIPFHAARPPQGWSAATLRHGSELLLGVRHRAEERADLVVCSKEWCGALRYQPHAEREGSRCPQCLGKKFRAFLDVYADAQAADSAIDVMDRIDIRER